MRWSVNWHCCVAEWKKIERRAVALNENEDENADAKRVSVATTEALALQRSGACDLNYHPEGKHREAQSSSSLSSSLERLMECKASDGRYLVTRKVHWQAVYRVLVDEGWYDASLGYAGFVDYIRSVAPPGGFRIMPDVETIRHISQTLYTRPFRDWRYDAAYGTKRWTYERMRRVAEVLQSCLGEEK